jgi:PAS domain-containing protein
MRDRHRGKNDLVVENTALHQQVKDLREEMRARRRVEDHLRSSMELCGSLVQLAPVAMARIDDTGGLVFANPAMGLLLGYSSGADLVAYGGGGKLFATDAVHEQVCRRLGNGPVELAAEFRHHDGRKLMVEVVAQAVSPVAGGGTVFYVVDRAGVMGGQAGVT